MKPVVFISHIHDEAAVAKWLKDSISKLLLGAVDFFVSSDRTAIIGGDRWLNKIEDALRESPVVLVLCSERSVLRPWVNFEAGGAWVAGKRVVPICHAGMEPSRLPEPLKSLQAYNLVLSQDYHDLVALLANEAGLNMPEFDPAEVLKDVPLIANSEAQGEAKAVEPETNEHVKKAVVTPPADVNVSFEKLQISQELHRYGLTLSVLLKETPDQDFFRVSLLWPKDVRVVNLQGLEEGEEEDIEGVRYIELSLHVDKRLWPGQIMKVIGGKASAQLHYEFDNDVHRRVHSNLRPKQYNLHYTVFLQSWQPVRGQVSFKELNIY